MGKKLNTTENISRFQACQVGGDCISHSRPYPTPFLNDYSQIAQRKTRPQKSNIDSSV